VGSKVARSVEESLSLDSGREGGADLEAMLDTMLGLSRDSSWK